MKKFFKAFIVILSLCLFSGGIVFLSGIVELPSIEQEEEKPAEVEDDANAETTNGYFWLRAERFDRNNPDGKAYDTVGGTVSAQFKGFLGVWANSGNGNDTEYSFSRGWEQQNGGDVRGYATAKSGYTFIGWFSDYTCAPEYFVSSASPYEANIANGKQISLYAKFAQSASYEIYVGPNKVSFPTSSNGGTISATIKNGNSSYTQTKSSSEGVGYGFYGLTFGNVFWGDTISISASPKTGYYYDGMYVVSASWYDYSDYTLTWGTKLTAATSYRGFSSVYIGVIFKVQV